MKRTITTIATAAAAFVAGALIIPATAQRAPQSGFGDAPQVQQRDRIHRDADAPGFSPRAHRFAPQADWDSPRPPRPPHGPHGAPPPPPHEGRVMFPFWQNEDLAADLGLSDEQVSQLQDSWELTREALESTKGSIQDAHEAVREEMSKDSPDLDTVYELSDAVNAAASEKKKIVLGHAVTVKNVLTAEQEEQLKDNARSFARERRGEFRGMRDDIRGIIQDGGTLEDVEAMLDEAGVGDFVKERILERVEQRLNGEGPAFGPGGQDAPRAKRFEGRRRGPRPDAPQAGWDLGTE